MSRKNATILDDDVDNGYRVGNVIKHMNSRTTTWTITEYVVNNPTNDFVITNNQTGKTKFVSVVNLDRYWVFYSPAPVRVWTPENGWEGNPTCSKCGAANEWVGIVDAPLTEYNSRRVPIALDSNGACSGCSVSQ